MFMPYLRVYDLSSKIQYSKYDLQHKIIVKQYTTYKASNITLELNSVSCKKCIRQSKFLSLPLFRATCFSHCLTNSFLVALKFTRVLIHVLISIALYVPLNWAVTPLE
jgi:hypothetical protein